MQFRFILWGKGPLFAKKHSLPFHFLPTGLRSAIIIIIIITIIMQWLTRRMSVMGIKYRRL